MFVEVIFKDKTKGRILRKEYEVNKDKGYILGLASEVKMEELPENKMQTPIIENKAKGRPKKSEN